ncbi:MAG: transcription termination/antitermination protein NusG [Nitrospirota bacterium]|nr:transcription termination/antitermination protein NusG [Nitrospirota bacterium]
MEKNWYVVHTYSGFENKVKTNIEEMVASQALQEKIGRVMIPTEEVVELKNGKKKVSTRKFFPGYILVEMTMDDEARHFIKSIPKVTGFVGGSTDPIPLEEHEVEGIFKQIDMGLAAPTVKVLYNRADVVRIIDGPFSGFTGTVEDVNPEQSKLRVMVSIFGRSTPVELDFLQVESAKES